MIVTCRRAILFPPAFFIFSIAALAQNPDTPNSALPVRAVSLFTSGVSYIERGGQVDGDATVPLTFRTAQINDILKSLVLLDENGQVQPVTYGAHDPIGRTLQSFAVDVTQPTSKAELLNRLRGRVGHGDNEYEPDVDRPDRRRGRQDHHDRR